MRVSALDRPGGPEARNRPGGVSDYGGFEMGMTPEDYRGRSNALGKELERICRLLDERAKALDKGVQPSEELGRKLQADWDSVLERIKELERQFWGPGNSN